jgi:hypothetical protein
MLLPTIDLNGNFSYIEILQMDLENAILDLENAIYI